MKNKNKPVIVEMPEDVMRYMRFTESVLAFCSKKGAYYPVKKIAIEISLHWQARLIDVYYELGRDKKGRKIGFEVRLVRILLARGKWSRPDVVLATAEIEGVDHETAILELRKEGLQRISNAQQMRQVRWILDKCVCAEPFLEHA
jgi:hypothetical protein